ncbi:MAG: YcxB family protein [Blastocatellia bacterium]|nr:YcxB family protein [Blastocatellia bacterium]
MEVEFHLTQADLIAFHKHLAETSWSGRWAFLIQYGIGLAVAWGVHLFANLSWVKTMFVAGLCIGFSRLLANSLRERQVFALGKQSYEAGRQRGAFANCRIRLEKRHLCEITQGKEYRRLWSEIHRVEQTSTHIFIFTNPTQGYVIPKQAFPSKNEMLAFNSQLLQLHQEAQ